MRGYWCRRAGVAVSLTTAAIIVAGSSSALAARRLVVHDQGASASATFNSCPTVADGEACSFTIIEVSTMRSAQDQTLNGGCVYLEQIRGLRQGPQSLTATSDTMVSNVCNHARVVIPRALGAATASGDLPTVVCDYETGACHPGRTTIDLRWTGVGPTAHTRPFTSRYADFDFGLPCVYHQTLGRTRDATIRASITGVARLGPVEPGDQMLSSGGGIFIGQNVGSCID